MPTNPLSVPRIGERGGIYISIGSDSWNNTFIIKNCTLYNNSATLVGGGSISCSLGPSANNAHMVTREAQATTNLLPVPGKVRLSKLPKPQPARCTLFPWIQLSVPHGIYWHTSYGVLRVCYFTLRATMLTEFLNSAQNTTVSVSDVRFVENHCTHETNCSAGLVIGLLFYGPPQLSGKVPANDTFICYNCTFESNIGGGVIIVATKDNVFTHRFGNIVFNKSNWMKNTSTIGAAVFMKPGIWDYTHEGCLPVPTFLHCTFESNSAIQSQPSYIKGINIRVTSLGFGALSATQFRVRFEGHALFRNNQGTVLHASNNVLDFSKGSVVEFIKNTANKGGSIAMYETSVLQFGNNCRFNFTGNRANLFRGAIYVKFNSAFHPEYQNCFIQPASQNCSKVNTTTFYFEGNYMPKLMEKLHSYLVHFSLTFTMLSFLKLCYNKLQISFSKTSHHLQPIRPALNLTPILQWKCPSELNISLIVL